MHSLSGLVAVDEVLLALWVVDRMSDLRDESNEPPTALEMPDWLLEQRILEFVGRREDGTQVLNFTEFGRTLMGTLNEIDARITMQEVSR